MSKCGKGCMPECEYFVTSGCISPFNCPYKIEENYRNNAFTSGNSNFLNGIEKWFMRLVEEGKIPQTPMNYDMASYKAYVAHLEAENAELKARLRIIKMALEYSCLESVQGNEKFLDEMQKNVNKYIKQAEDVFNSKKNGIRFTFTDARLKELQGGKE